MSDKIEQVARAIAVAGNGGVWTDENWYKEYQRDIHRIRARAAIEAMREPTEAMIEAVCPVAFFDTDNRAYIRSDYGKMIDTALAPRTIDEEIDRLGHLVAKAAGTEYVGKSNVGGEHPDADSKTAIEAALDQIRAFRNEQ